MKIFLLFIFLICAYLSSGQKLQRNEQDKYTKLWIKETSLENLAREGYNEVNANFMKRGDTTFLVLNPKFFNNRITMESDVLYLLLSNNESIQMKCQWFTDAKFELIGGGTVFSNTAFYPLSTEYIEKLKLFNIIGVRFSLTQVDVTFDDIKQKKAEKIKKAIGIIESPIK